MFRRVQTQYFSLFCLLIIKTLFLHFFYLILLIYLRSTYVLLITYLFLLMLNKLF